MNKNIPPFCIQNGLGPVGQLLDILRIFITIYWFVHKVADEDVMLDDTVVKNELACSENAEELKD